MTRNIRKTIVVISRLRWYTFVDHLANQGWVSRIGSGVLILFLGYTYWNSAPGLFAFINLADAETARKSLQLFNLIFFVAIWIYYTNIVKMAEGLLHFLAQQPLSSKTLYVTFSLAEQVNTWMLLLVPFFVSLKMALHIVGIGAQLNYWLATLLFVISCISLARLAQHLAGYLRTVPSQTKQRMIYAVCLAATLLLIALLIKGGMRFGAVVEELHRLAENWMSFAFLFPSGYYSDLVDDIIQHAPIEQSIESYVYQIIYIGVLQVMGYWMWQMQRRSGQLGTANSGGKRLVDLALIEAVGRHRYVALCMKEIVHLFRTGMFVLIVLSELLVIGFFGVRGKLTPHEGLATMLYLFALWQVVPNSNMFGASGGGLWRDLALPVRGLSVVLAKNAARFLLLAMMFLPGWGVFFYRRWSELGIFDAGFSLLFFLSASVFYVAAGNVTSYFFPRFATVGELGPGMAKGAWIPAWVAVGVPLLVFGGAYFARRSGNFGPHFPYVVMFVFLIAACVFYGIVVRLLGAAMERRKEDLLGRIGL